MTQKRFVLESLPACPRSPRVNIGRFVPVLPPVADGASSFRPMLHDTNERVADFHDRAPDLGSNLRANVLEQVLYHARGHNESTSAGSSESDT